jgi:nicotinamidase-related amidase
VQHAGKEFERGSAEWQWAPPLAPAAGEPVVHKDFNSAFEATDLEARLAERAATHVVLAGASTNWCIRATAYGALDRGYDLTLVEDAHTTETKALGNGRRIEAQAVVDELNVALTWLEYPGRANGTATADAVDFHAPARRR